MRIAITYAPEEVYDVQQVKDMIESISAWQDPVHTLELYEQGEISDNDS